MAPLFLDGPRPALRFRQELVGRTLDVGLTAAAHLVRLHPGASAERAGLHVERDVPYRAGGRRAHLLDVYVPSTEGPWPVVLYLHGGSFRILSKESHAGCAVALARAGCLVLSANYRLGAAHPYPAALEDAVDAVLWAAEHAPT